jgi:hypothetical protein
LTLHLTVDSINISFMFQNAVTIFNMAVFIIPYHSTKIHEKENICINHTKNA